jgi:hypothetical protein
MHLSISFAMDPQNHPHKDNLEIHVLAHLTTLIGQPKELNHLIVYLEEFRPTQSSILRTRKNPLKDPFKYA